MDQDKFKTALAKLESTAKSQLFHTGSDSAPASWAGTTAEDQDEHKDGIDDNGTDYEGVKKALANKVAKSKALTPAEVAIVKGADPRQLIAAKVSKGETLTPAESWVIKGGFAKMSKATEMPAKAKDVGEDDSATTVPETNAGADEDDEIEADAKKSLVAAAKGSAAIKKGLEMSPFLVDFASAVNEALQGTEARTVQKVTKAIAKSLGALVAKVETIEKSLHAHVESQTEFNKGSADVLFGLGQHLASQIEHANEQASMPATGPRSQSRPANLQIVEKSFAGGLDTGTDALVKSQIIDHMAEMVQKGQLSSLEVVKYESTGELSQHAAALVNKKISGSR